MDIVESVTENSTDDQIPTARAVKNAIASGTGGTAEGAVLYTAQNLTPEQQAQARKNIGAAAVGESGGSLSAEIIDNILVVNLPGNLTASIQNGVLTVA